MEEKTMNEEKSMVEYKESKGIFGWLKSKFENLKERFSTTRKTEESKKESQEEQELYEEDLDNVLAGIPFEPELVNVDELINDLSKEEPKSWELTDEEKEIANSPIEHDELTEEDLDQITAGHPIIEDDEHSR